MRAIEQIRMSEVDELAASIAHEVNQPLAAIVANAECCLVSLGKDEPDLDRARRAAERIVSNGHHASNVIRSIRAMLRRESLDLARLQINDVITGVVDSLASELRRQRVTVELRLCSDLEPIVGDRVQLQQVMINLLRNATDSLAQVPARSRFLQVSTAPHDGGSVLVCVSDSGTGLDEAAVTRMFEPFFTTRKEGMGLGLSICRSIVEAHRGRLWATPRTPRGATFRFTLSARSDYP
jgi:C4-dicarboxylate-specific signal transduction histidine kinase